MTVFADSVEDDNGIVERVSYQSEERGDDGEVDLEVADEQFFTYWGRGDVCAGSDGAEYDTDVVDECNDCGDAVSNVSESDPDVSDDGEQRQDDGDEGLLHGFGADGRINLRYSWQRSFDAGSGDYFVLFTVEEPCPFVFGYLSETGVGFYADVCEGIYSLFGR